MSNDVYFIQVSDADASELEQVANNLTGFLKTEDAHAIVVPETVDPLDRDEAKQYLEGMADALDMELKEK